VSEVIIAVEPGFFSQYDAPAKGVKKKFRKQIGFLKANPRHQSLQIHRIEGTDFLEFYVDKGYRCLFKQQGGTYMLYYVGTHPLIDRL
jgi:hypothetical protein